MSAKPEEVASLAPLEAGDEFEDFPVQNWTGVDQNTLDQNLWEEEWEDDDEAEDDFATQIKKELEKNKSGSA